MNGLDGQASLISCGGGAHKALGPSGAVPVGGVSPALPWHSSAPCWEERGCSALCPPRHGRGPGCSSGSLLCWVLPFKWCCAASLLSAEMPQTQRRNQHGDNYVGLCQYSSQLRRITSCACRASFKVIPNITQDFLPC